MENILKYKKLLIAVVIIVITFIIALSILTPDKMVNIGVVQSDEVLKTGDFEITVVDYYNADYFYDENSVFDKYLGVEVEITNTSGKEKTVNALKSFRLMDSRGTYLMPVIDENYKIFSATLQNDETFYIPLTFAVMDDESYTLYFNSTLKEEDNGVNGFLLPASNLETKKVPLTLDHILTKRGSDEPLIKEKEEDSDENEVETDADENEVETDEAVEVDNE